MCAGMCTIWPIDGASEGSTLAYASARSGLGDAFDGMKVIVDRSEVTRVALQHRFQNRKNLRRFFPGRAVVVP